MTKPREGSDDAAVGRPSAGRGLHRRDFLGTALATTVVTAGAAAGCGPAGRPTAAAATTPAGATPPPVAEMMSWIDQVVARGVRRPGYAADGWTTGFVAQKFREFGLVDVHAEPVAVTRWEPERYTLTATPAGAAARDLACFPLPHAAPASRLEAQLASFDAASPSAVAGRAALVDARPLALPPAVPAGLGSAPKDLSRRVYDPAGTFAGETQVLPLASTSDAVTDPAAQAGAVAFIGCLVGYPSGGHRYYFPYNGKPTALPGVWIGAGDGRWLRDQLARGPVRVRLDVATSTAPARSDNVVGDLPGPPGDDELVLIGSHHDAPWASAVEDGSGIAMVLAQARYWSRVPAADRPHRMRFLLQGGHFHGGAGLVDYVAKHGTELAKVVLEVHLEHAARDVAAAGGRLTATGRCVPRWFFTSRIPALESTVYDALVAERLGRSMLLAPDAFGPMPLSDGALYYPAGVPIVQFLSAPWYLFDEADTLDKVDQDSLLPITRAVIRILDATRAMTAAGLRAQRVRPPAQSGSPS
ncbi:M28 family peptidase [Pseudofrankia sp. DC12]|uniref:M28 family peptidase n=1 Tax=Pseudofrankia sp. DC12 TaxID=683315 RepID=UPI0005F849B0|nr:M28 family peptidase [Pseudofrankia sp. DC12]